MRKLLLLALLSLSLWGDAHIFVFHRFGDAAHAATNTSLEVLRAEFEYLKRNGYTVVSLATLAEAYEKRQPIDPKWVVLTIDDSYRSFYENALPLFREYGYPFTLFVYAEATDRRYGDFMSWEEIREAARYGEIGAHSYGHGHMASMDGEAVREDTRRAFASFEKELGYRPRYFAYPYGEYKPETRDAVAAFGFDLILNQNSGAVDAQSDPLDLDRSALTGGNTLAQKLKIRTLTTRWHTPTSWPRDGKLKTIHATIPANVTELEYYVSGHGWQRIKAHDGTVRIATDLPLKFRRTRIFLKQGVRQSSIILVKE